MVMSSSEGKDYAGVVNDVSLWNEGLCCMCCAVVLVNDVSLWNEGLCWSVGEWCQSEIKDCGVCAVL